ncbi:hypothetical protein C4561_03255 [candidate division WWE3 bacterium]|jgi:hypothetical protein|uniref:Uncharacterized protein n=1 Tax=candidate division WWE3 bacterium TaxID=2053526 RepID=A0A3A4ZD68_UNCKA|nr:MAG: hypothetical protein C4561_03255 [candidate division WWE3 bacterium]
MPNRPETTRQAYNYIPNAGEAAPAQDPPNEAPPQQTAPETQQQRAPENPFAQYKTRKEIDDKIKEIEQKLLESEEIPQHDRIFSVYEHGKKETRSTTEESLLRKSFEQSNRDKANEPEGEAAMRKELHLGFAKVLAEGQEIDFDAVRNENGPQIFIRQVMEYDDKRNWLEKQRDNYLTWKAQRKGQTYKPDPAKLVAKPTGEVSVTIVMNNGKTEDDNTVLSGVFKYENNRINLNARSEMELMTEKDFKGYQERRNVREQYRSEKDKGPLKTRTRRVSAYADNSLQAKLARGEMTLDSYQTEFTNNNGVTPQEHWERWDQMLDRDLRAAESDRYKGELMERLTTQYNEQLQQAQERRSQIMAEVALKAKETRTRNEAIMNNPDFMWLVEKITAGGDPKEIARIRKHVSSYAARVVRDEDIDPEQLIDQMLQRKGVTI